MVRKYVGFYIQESRDAAKHRKTVTFNTKLAKIFKPKCDTPRVYRPKIVFCRLRQTSFIVTLYYVDWKIPLNSECQRLVLMYYLIYTLLLTTKDITLSGKFGLYILLYFCILSDVTKQNCIIKLHFRVLIFS